MSGHTRQQFSTNLDRNPITLVPQSAKRTRVPDVLTVQEIGKLLGELADRVVLPCMWQSLLGFRVSELLALKWADMDFAAGEIQLSRGIVRQHIGEMKTEASRKPVPLGAGLAAVLLGWRGCCPYNQDADYIFGSPDKDGKTTRTGLTLLWKITSGPLQTSRNPEAVRLAHAPSHVWNAGKQPRRGCCHHARIAPARKRQHHDGPLRPSRDASEASSAITHRGKHSVPKRSHAVDGIVCNCLNRKRWALNSAVECHLHTVEVTGSNPVAPTIFIF
jgi:hypothetical protein